MTVRSLFPTLLYEAEIADAGLLAELAHSIRSLARDDGAGVRWSREKNYSGYTSYASLNDLPKRDPALADLARRLARHAASFADECGFDLRRKLRLDSLWVNLLKAGGHHWTYSSARSSRDLLRRSAARPLHPFEARARCDGAPAPFGRSSSPSSRVPECSMWIS